MLKEEKKFRWPFRLPNSFLFPKQQTTATRRPEPQQLRAVKPHASAGSYFEMVNLRIPRPIMDFAELPLLIEGSNITRLVLPENWASDPWCF